jgi:hypothetical protein
LALYLARLETLEGNAIATKSAAESVASDPIRFIGDNK